VEKALGNFELLDIIKGIMRFAQIAIPWNRPDCFGFI